ncbi:MAG: hypothetical protein KDA47_24555, partial [Planctomycetales bacterium]|nr:hypothetical protein [Planctomycetales bacterium]
MLPRLCLLTCVLLGSGLSAIAHAKPFLIPVGAAKVDITPEVPVRLSGYGNRRVEATEAAQRIWAKALAIGDEHTGGRAILLT